MKAGQAGEGFRFEASAIWAGSLALLLSLLLGCSSGSPAVSLSPPAKAPAADDYDRIRVRWSREDRVLKKLDTTLYVWATLFSPEFTAAFLARRTRMFRLTAAEHATAAQQLRDQIGTGFQFFVSATSTDARWLDFEAKTSVWRIALVNGGGEQVTPVHIQHDREINATVLELFPYVGDFHRTYTIRFPATLPDGRPLLRSENEQLVLLFIGPLGRAELVWRLRR